MYPDRRGREREKEKGRNGKQMFISPYNSFKSSQIGGDDGKQCVPSNVYINDNCLHAPSKPKSSDRSNPF